jgi:hypothetical protein
LLVRDETCTCARFDGNTNTATVYDTISTPRCGCDSNDLVEPEIVAACRLGP